MMRLLCRIFCLWGLFFLSSKMQAQCFTIESILVNACSQVSGNEGQNEMVRFTVGPSPLNTSDLNVTWATVGNTWTGVCQNTATANIVAQLNATITNSCGLILEPTGGILPANAKVILVSGYTGFSVTSNSFATLTETIYIIFHCSNSTGGNFANSGTGTRTFSMSFVPNSSGCIETVVYSPGSLSNSDGASVNFSSSGIASYVNNGCTAPIPVYDPSWTAPNPICSGASSIDLNTLITGTPGGTWSGAGVSGNTFSPAGLSGNQNITYTYTPLCGSAVSETHVISVTASGFGNSAWTSTSVCSNQGTINLNSLITGTIGGTWTGTGVTGSNFDPTAGTQSITYTLGSGTCAEVLTQSITVTPQPSPLSISGTTAYCSGETMTALSTSPSSGISVFWFSDNALSNQVSSSNTFTPPASSSTYYVYQGTSTCHSTPTIVSITVNPVPATPVLPALVEWCSGASLPNISSTSSATSLNWFSDAALTNLVGTGNSFQISNSSIPAYYVYDGTASCHSNSVIVNINVKPTPSAPVLPAQIDWCSGSSFPSISTPLNASSVNWYTDAALTNLVGSGNIFQISSSIISTYFATAEENGCESASSRTNFNIRFPINASIVGNSIIEACLPEVVNLQSSELYGNSWSTGDTAQSISVLEAGVYTLNVVGFCNTSTDFVTVVDVSADASFNVELDNPGMLPLTATLTPTGNSSDNCAWYLNGVLQNFTGDNVLVFTQTGTFEIMHECSNAGGCVDKEIYSVNAKFPNDFYVPNAFSPNSDGVNDVFGISGIGIEKLEILIFDSWGEEVFVIQNPNQTWDGKMNSGEILPDGLYVYKLVARDTEGNPFYKNGTLLLIR
jgi:gliding motility-associated-like protein